ncbi:DEK-like protein [Labeo rohita]|uniref:Protein DEK n=1 Tax=Labeo rohita TaxID=84645 RepID=A0A498LZ91_LABRO|nr:DEK-like protein [Labeo rohita]
MSKPKEKPKIESTGRGAKLGDIARINHCIGKLKAPMLKPLHKIVYDRPGAASTLRKNLRLFNGFSFGEDSDLYNKKMEKKTPPQKKSSTKKSTKKSGKSEQTASDESDQDVHEDKNAKKTKKPAAKRKAPAKPVPKTKKADSSSNRGKKKASKSKDESESSDDDQPLIKMIKKPPTEEQLKEAIKDLLKDANLEEVTMKQITRQVYDKYPDFDLTSRKEFIRETVKGLIS